MRSGAQFCGLKTIKETVRSVAVMIAPSQGDLRHPGRMSFAVEEEEPLLMCKEEGFSLGSINLLHSSQADDAIWIGSKALDF
jgi:hypothetical protein